MTSPHCAEVARVDRHFDGHLGAVDEHVMREHLPSCEPCRTRYERHLVIEAIDPLALGPQRRIARGLGLATSPRAQVVRWAAPAVAALAMAAALLLVLGLRDPSHGFTARGGEATAAADLFVYRAVDHGEPVRAGATIGPRDELAFAYENPSAKPFVMIFGVDEHRRLVWYYPAWSSEHEEPVSIRADRSAGRHRLAEAIAHDLEGRSLEVHVLFSDEAISVRTIERLVASAPSKLAAVLPPGAVDQSVSFTVER